MTSSKTKLQPLTINVPADVLLQAKVICAANRVSLSSVISGLLRDQYIPAHAGLVGQILGRTKVQAP